MKSTPHCQVVAVNVRGTFLSMKHELRHMLSCGSGGAIVNIASTAGTGPFPEFTAYCSSKHAVVGMTKSAALEYIKMGIRINCICPATTDTPMVERFTAQWPEWQEKTNSSYGIGRIARVRIQFRYFITRGRSHRLACSAAAAGRGNRSCGSFSG
eukprot:SAG31_NODE_2865_length_4981_cov_4.988529_4_plen_155_part_00